MYQEVETPGIDREWEEGFLQAGCSRIKSKSGKIRKKKKNE